MYKFTRSLEVFLFESFAFECKAVFLCLFFLIPSLLIAQDSSVLPSDTSDEELLVGSGDIHVSGGAVICHFSESDIAQEEVLCSSTKKITASPAENSAKIRSQKRMISKTKKTENSPKSDDRVAPPKHLLELPVQENPIFFTVNKTKSSLVLSQKDYSVVLLNTDYFTAQNLRYLQVSGYKTADVVYRFYSRFYCRPPPVA